MGARDHSPFSSFFEEMFPSISQKTRAKIKSYLINQHDHKWLYKNKSAIHRQGDIFSEIPAFFYSDGKVKTANACPIIVLEHTCDLSIDNKKTRTNNYVIAPLLPYGPIKVALKGNSEALKANLSTHKIFLSHVPGLDGGGHVVDLNMLSNVQSDWFHQAVDNESLKGHCSLSENGFYFLLAKLTVHLMRAS